VAPDARHVEVVFEMQEAILDRLGLSWGKQERLHVPESLRVQLSTTGITGAKYLRLDIFEHPQPPPELPFDPGPNYIPAVPSTLKNLEDAFLRALEELPELAGGLRQILDQTYEILEDVQEKQLPARATHLFERAERVMDVMETAIEDLETRELSLQARATLRNLNRTLVPMRAVLERVSAPDGLIDSADRAADGLGDLTVGGGGRGDLVETLRSLRAMAESVRRFTDALERDPDMLLKGRAQERAR
jgi:paraquat-inducible protein B